MKAAQLKHDSSILIHINDKDCVSLEVRYHKSCYRNYTRFLSTSSACMDSNQPTPKDETAGYVNVVCFSYPCADTGVFFGHRNPVQNPPF